MKYIINVLIVLSFSIHWASSCKKHEKGPSPKDEDEEIVYYSGFSKKSIEPSSYPFSLAFSGYAFPPDGRFTLEWKNFATADDIRFITSDGNSFLAVRNEEVLISELTNSITWNSIGIAKGVQLLTGNGTQLFYIDHTDDIYYSEFKQSLQWMKIGSVPNAVAITCDGNLLFIGQDNGNILYTYINKGFSEWRNLPRLSDIKSLATFRGNVYALTKQNDIFKYDYLTYYEYWIKIARKNNVTYREDMQYIAVINEKLYGFDANNTIYNAQHKSKQNSFVTSLTISLEGKIAVITGVDVCGIEAAFVNEVKYEVYRKHGIPPSAILINTSHTHFAPVAQNFPTWREHNQQPNEQYLYEVLKPAILESIDIAINDLEPSELYFGRGKTAIGYNRSLPGQDVPNDDDLDVLTIVNKSDRSETVLFLAACHPVAGNSEADVYTISPNFPGIARELIANRPNISDAIFIQGCAGDINPVDPNYIRTGEMLAAEVLSVADQKMKKLQGDISYYMDSVNILANVWSRGQILAFREQNIHSWGDVSAEKNVRWADLMLQLDSENNLPEAMPVYIQTINIGEWKLIGLSREAVAEYGIGIKSLWPQKIISVAAYCNDVSSYLPSQRHVELRTYEGYDSFFWYGQPSTFPGTVYDQVLNTIKNSER